jgi:hypothetical protein
MCTYADNWLISSERKYMKKGEEKGEEIQRKRKKEEKLRENES